MEVSPLNPLPPSCDRCKGDGILSPAAQTERLVKVLKAFKTSSTTRQFPNSFSLLTIMSLGGFVATDEMRACLASVGEFSSIQILSLHSHLPGSKEESTLTSAARAVKRSRLQVRRVTRA